MVENILVQFIVKTLLPKEEEKLFILMDQLMMDNGHKVYFMVKVSILGPIELHMMEAINMVSNTATVSMLIHRKIFTRANG